MPKFKGVKWNIGNHRRKLWWFSYAMNLVIPWSGSIPPHGDRQPGVKMQKPTNTGERTR